jgi:hypothetical protein
MPREAERLADGLWRQLRHVVVSMVDAALRDTGPACADSATDEAAYIERSAAAQLARFRTKQDRVKASPPAGRRRSAKP